MAEELIVQDIAEKRKREVLGYVQNFYRRSWDWRAKFFHYKWDCNDRDYHSIYDPQRAAQKRDWQETIHTGMTVSNVETLHGQIYKTMMAPKPPIQCVRGPAGDDLQARLIQDAVAYEMFKSEFDVNFYDASKESCKYGSGFMKFYWETVEDTRRRRELVEGNPADLVPTMTPEQLVGVQPLPQPPVQGFAMQSQRVLIKDHLASKYVHIRDVFPEPNTKSWDKVIHRDKITYGEIVRNILDGRFFDVRGQIENMTEGDKFEADLTTIQQELGYYDAGREYSKFEKPHTVWELCAPIPRKWINFDIPEGDQAEELVPGRVMVVSGIALLSSEENDKMDGESMILKLDYIRTGEPYGMGVCDLIGDDQALQNETVSQRVDNINLILNKGIAIIEAALVNAEQDIEVRPGWLLRLKSNWDDAKKALYPIEFQDVTASSYRESIEIGLRVQEKTGANKVTLGTSSQVTDTNQTLGGMEMLKQMFNDRVASLGMVMESAFLMRAASKIYGLIYQRFATDPEGLLPILGDDPVQIGEIPNPIDPMGPPQPHIVPRYMAFAFPPPEMVNQSYQFKPMGIFSMENKIVKSAQIMDLIKLNIANPSFDATAASKYLAVTVQGIGEAEHWFRPVPMIPLSMIPPELLPMIMGGKKPETNKKDLPGMKGGENGNGASFGPGNPVRRQPVVA